MTTSDETPSTVVRISAGGVEVELNGPKVTPNAALKLWREVSTTQSGRSSIGAGTGLVAEQANEWTPGMPPNPQYGQDAEVPLGFVLGKDGEHYRPMADPDGHLARMGFTVATNEAIVRERPPGCFHPWPGCNC